jgi:hypothetical protein
VDTVEDELGVRPPVQNPGDHALQRHDTLQVREMIKYKILVIFRLCQLLDRFEVREPGRVDRPMKGFNRGRVDAPGDQSLAADQAH